MTNDKHTPGPWRFRDSEDVAHSMIFNAAGDCAIAQMIDNIRAGTTRHLVEMRANAKLIAAAPAMKEMLEAEASQLERWAHESRQGGWSTHQVEPMLERASEIRMLLASLR